MIEHWQVHPLGLIHLFVAFSAIVLGAMVIFARKGTGRHRWLGRGYVVMMLAVNGTALAIYELFGRFGVFHWMALASLVTVVIGYLPVRKRGFRWKPRHAYFMTWSYVGLLAALASEIGTRTEVLPFFGAVAVASVTVIIVGAWLIQRHVPRLLASADTPSRSPSGGMGAGRLDE
jgi:uncharacterized membrane protein